MTIGSNYKINILESNDSLDGWDEFVETVPQRSIFCRSWWLRAVCGDQFKIITLRKNGIMIAGMPLTFSSRRSKINVAMPPLTQTLGVLLPPSPKASYKARLSDEIMVQKELIAAIPKFSRFAMNFHYNYNNWLPFYWAGYRQTTYYTYRITDISNLDAVFNDFSTSKKGHIEQARKLVRVFDDYSPEDFYRHHEMSLRKSGKTIDYRRDLFLRLYAASKQHSAGKIWAAKDGQNNIHAAIYVVFDPASAYYLISSTDPDFKPSGALSLLIMESIKEMSQRTKQYDFEGSMIPGVEHSFRKFGAIQTPYFNIYKDNSWATNAGRFVLEKLRGSIK